MQRQEVANHRTTFRLSKICELESHLMCRKIHPFHVFQEGVCHLGSKASKVTFLNSDRLLTTGFSRHSDRQYSIWNQDDVSHALLTDIIDSSSGIVFPFFDYDTNIIYLAGKGDGNIRYYEVVDEHPYVHFLSQFLSGKPQVRMKYMNLDFFKRKIPRLKKFR